MDDMWSEEWDAFVEDDDLIAMAAENLPLVEHSYQVDLNLQQGNNDDKSDQEDNESDLLFDDLPDYVAGLNFTD